MKHRLHLYALTVVMILTIISCSIFTPADDRLQEVDPEEMPELSQAQAIDMVWEALEPNTSSHNRSNWQVVEAQLVPGESVVERFEGEPAPGCWSGPEPVENKDISGTKEYWYVLMVPNPATPEPFYGTASPTAPPLIPEPFLREAHFLVHPESGDIPARKLICVIY